MCASNSDDRMSSWHFEAQKTEKLWKSSLTSCIMMTFSYGSLRKCSIHFYKMSSYKKAFLRENFLLNSLFDGFELKIIRNKSKSSTESSLQLLLYLIIITNFLSSSSLQPLLVFLSPLFSLNGRCTDCLWPNIIYPCYVRQDKRSKRLRPVEMDFWKWHVWMTLKFVLIYCTVRF